MIPFDGLSKTMDDFLADQSFRLDAKSPGTIQLVGIRGCKIVKEGKSVAGISVTPHPEAITNRYDDVMFVYGIKPLPSAPRFAAVYPMSTQPGIKSFFLYGSGSGCPVVQSGQYPYSRGLHKGKYKALRQQGPVVAIRDVNKDLVLDPIKDRWDYPRWTGINIHAGGTSATVDGWSAGCQVIQGGWGGRNWKEFFNFVYNTAATQIIFHYTLIDGWTFGQWFNLCQAGRRFRNLFFGSYGQSVRLLQSALCKEGFYHSSGIDGEFGIATHQAVRRWQGDLGLVITGAVNEGMMATLGIDTW